jgi:hypothetical protein
MSAGEVELGMQEWYIVSGCPCIEVLGMNLWRGIWCRDTLRVEGGVRGMRGILR